MCYAPLIMHTHATHPHYVLYTRYVLYAPLLHAKCMYLCYVLCTPSLCTTQTHNVQHTSVSCTTSTPITCYAHPHYAQVTKRNCDLTFLFTVESVCFFSNARLTSLISLISSAKLSPVVSFGKSLLLPSWFALISMLLFLGAMFAGFCEFWALWLFLTSHFSPILSLSFETTSLGTLPTVILFLSGKYGWSSCLVNLGGVSDSWDASKSSAGRFKDEGLDLALTSGKAFSSLFLYRQQRNYKHDQNRYEDRDSEKSIFSQRSLLFTNECEYKFILHLLWCSWESIIFWRVFNIHWMCHIFSVENRRHNFWQENINFYPICKFNTTLIQTIAK